MIILFLAIVFSPIQSSAEDFYITLTGAGSRNGSTWANAWSWSDLNTSSNWASNETAGKIDAGDTVYISGGSSGVTYTSTLTCYASGESGSPITIKTGAMSGSPSGHDGLVTINSSSTSAIYLGSKDYITIDGKDEAESINMLLTGNTYGIYVDGDSDHVTIRYVEADNNSHSGVFTTYNDSANYLLIQYGLFENNGKYGLYLDLQNDCSGYEDVIFEYNTIRNNGSDGVTCGKCATGRYNKISTGSGSHRDGWEAYGGSNNGYLKIYGNEFGGSGNAMFWGDPRGSRGPIWIYNNHFYCDSDVTPCTDENGIRFRPAGGSGFEIHILNNTFTYNLYEAIHIGGKGGTFSTIDIRNNIIYESGGGSGLEIESDVGSPTITVDYNVLYGPDYGETSLKIKGQTYSCSGGSYSTYNTNGSCNEVSLTDPVYGAEGNVRLSSGDTAAKEMGTDLSAYFTVDKDGISRPQGSAWDVGAYEYYEYEDGPPSPPRNIRIIE